MTTPARGCGTSRVAIVTDAAHGIGTGVAKLLADRVSERNGTNQADPCPAPHKSGYHTGPNEVRR